MEEGLMDAGILRKLRVKGRRHNVSLLHDNSVFSFCTEDFDGRPTPLNARSTNKYHLNRNVFKLPFADGAFQLSSVGVTSDININRAEAYLLWVLNLFRE